MKTKLLKLNRFLVTGATGFLGSALVEKLLNENYKVIGMDIKEKGFLSNKVFSNKNFIFFKKNLNNNFSKFLRGFKIDGIFHLASQQPTFNNLSYIDYYRGNVKTTLNVINFIKSKKIKFVIYASSVSIFGISSKERFIDEDTPFFPLDYYSLTKYTAERLLEIGLKYTKTKVIIVRFASMFGKNHLGGIVHTYYQLAKNGKDIKVYNWGERFRNLLYIQDAGDILIKIVENFNLLNKFEIFVAGSKNSLKTIEIAQKTKELLRSNSKIIPVDKVTTANQDVFINISKSKKMLNFNPMRIEDGLKFFLKEINNEI